MTDEPGDALAELAARTRAARDELAALRSDDPAARQAIHAARLTVLTLDRFWLAALDTE